MHGTDAVHTRARDGAAAEAKTPDAAAERAVNLDSTEAKETEHQAPEHQQWVYRLLQHAPAAIAVLRGPEHVYELSNSVNNELLGKDPTGLSVRVAFPEIVAQGFDRLLDEVYRTGLPFSAREARFVFARDGKPTEGFATFVYEPIPGPQGVEGIMVLGFDVTEQVLARRTAEETAERIQKLQNVTAALSGAMTRDSVVNITVDQGREALGARGGGLWIVHNNHAELVHSTNLSNAALSKFGAVPLDHPVMRPVFDALARGEPVCIASKADAVARYPDFAKMLSYASGEYAVACLPLAVEGRTIGAISFSFDDAHHFGVEDRTFLQVLARLSAQAYERCRAFDVEANAVRRLSLLAEIAGVLSEAALDLQRILDTIVQRLGDRTGASATLSLMTPDSGTVESVAVHHPDPQIEADLAATVRATPPRLGEGIAGRVLQSGKSLFIPVVEKSTIRDTWMKEHAEFVANHPIHSIIGVPIRAEGKLYGAITLSRHGEREPFTEDDLRLMEDIAHRAGVAIASARKHQELRASEERFRFLSEAIPQIVWSTRADGAMDFFNRRWSDFTGLDGEASTAGAWSAALHPTDCQPFLDRWRAALSSGDTFEFECRIRRGSDGEYRWMIARAVPVRDSSGRIQRWFGTCTDIHEQKQSEQAKAEAVKLREDFLSIAGHELRTPLSSLQLQVQSLQRLAAKEDLPSDRVAQRLSKIERHVGRLETLISELLDVGRITAGRLQLKPERIDLAALAAEVAERFVSDLAQNKCELRMHTPAPVVGHWDSLRLDQVVTNLLANAVKYGAGSPIEVGVTSEKDGALLVVRDYGIGIAPEYRDRIFQRFERAVSDRHYAGLGLGLWITRQIVLAHGGDIRFDSTPGHGTTFAVELPFRRPGE